MAKLSTYALDSEEGRQVSRLATSVRPVEVTTNPDTTTFVDGRASAYLVTTSGSGSIEGLRIAQNLFSDELANDGQDPTRVNRTTAIILKTKGDPADILRTGLSRTDEESTEYPSYILDPLGVTIAITTGTHDIDLSDEGAYITYFVNGDEFELRDIAGWAAPSLTRQVYSVYDLNNPGKLLISADPAGGIVGGTDIPPPPETDPHVIGQVWVDNGVWKVSAG